MTPVEAIHTATRNIGPLVGLETGKVQEGCLADLFMVRRRPDAPTSGCSWTRPAASPS